MPPEIGAYLWDALEAAEFAQSIAEKSSRREFSDDWILQAAAERKLEILGEALNRIRQTDLPTALRIPSVNEIIATRHVIAHGYATVDSERVWRMIRDDLPQLIVSLRNLLEEFGPPPR
ncbi:DUF86 domain-containing protein [Brevibacterium sp. NPDC059310]|uniref:HepT-like ribonuclease domain-containing protein n=1 Tax=Brevibacterium sp. NPDC059310 TaxID=3346802 RepID=UPI00367330FB